MFRYGALLNCFRVGRALQLSGCTRRSPNTDTHCFQRCSAVPFNTRVIVLMLFLAYAKTSQLLHFIIEEAWVVAMSKGTLFRTDFLARGRTQARIPRRMRSVASEDVPLVTACQATALSVLVLRGHDVFRVGLLFFFHCMRLRLRSLPTACCFGPSSVDRVIVGLVTPAIFLFTSSTK